MYPHKICLFSGCEMDMRELKALEIAARSRVAFDGTTWAVPSQSGNGVYRVSIGTPPSCPCDDFLLRNQPCKHVIAARLVCERDHNGKPPVVVADVVPKRLTYKQNWPLYDKAQITEKRRFLELLFDLTRRIEEPTQTCGRKRVPLADQIVAVAFKVYSTVSARRFGTDLEDAFQRGYLSRRVHPVSIGAFLETDALTPHLESLIVQSSLPLRSVESTFSPDSTGFSTSRFVRWYDEKYGVERSGKEWVKAHAICGAKTHIVTAVHIAGPTAADSPQFKKLVETTAENFPIDTVCADKAYLGRDNLELVAGLGGTPFIPFKVNSIDGDGVWSRMFHYYQYRREEFLKRYHARSSIESTFSMLKAKFRDHVRSRTDIAMKNEVLCKFLCHNIVVVHQSIIELGIDGEFWPDEPKDDQLPSTIKFARPG